MNWRNAAAILTGLLLIALVVIYFLLDSVSEKDSTFKRDREAGNNRERSLQAKLSKSSGYVSTLENDLSELREMYADRNDSLKRKIRASIVRLIPLDKIDRLDTCLHQVEIRNKTLTYQTALISSLEAEKVETKAKNDEIKLELSGQIKLLDSANTAKFNKIDSLYDNWPKKQSAWGIGGTAGISTLMTDGKFHAGPGVTFGLTYKIPIKKIRLRDLFRRKS